MSQQEEGWPLGLQPLNVRVGLVRNRDVNGSLSFNTLFSGSPTSSADSSSDLDTESTGSFFHDNSITLGSLIGISSILELSRRSMRGRTIDPVRDKKSYKSRPWFFSLCSKLSTDAVNMNDTPSLGHLVEAERRATNMYRRNQSPAIMEPTISPMFFLFQSLIHYLLETMLLLLSHVQMKVSPTETYLNIVMVMELYFSHVYADSLLIEGRPS